MSDALDVDWLLEFHRNTFGGARMETETPPEPPAPTGPPAPAPGEKQLPQSQVNEIIQTRTKEAREKALKDLADELGVPIEDAKRIVKERQDADERNATELEKANKAKAQAEADRDEKVSAKDSELHAERADRALIAAGVPDEDSKLERLRGMLTVKPGATKDEIKADVEKLKTDFPALFTESKTPPPPPKRISTDPPKAPNGTKVEDTAFGRGQQRAAERYSQESSVPRPPIPGVTT